MTDKIYTSTIEREYPAKLKFFRKI